MKRTFFHSMLFLVVMLFCTSLSAQKSKDIYLLYDGNCLKKYQYKFSNNDQVHHYDYHYLVNDYLTYTFRVDVNYNYKVFKKKLPAKAILCGGQFGEDIVKNVNSAEQFVFIVHEVEGGYELHRVTKSASISRANGIERIASTDYNFSIDTNKDSYLPLDKLNDSRSKMDVFYVEGKAHFCGQKFLVRKFNDYVCLAPLDMEFVPKIGIVREVISASKFAPKEEYYLSSINGIGAQSYMAKKCNPLISPPVAVAAPPVPLPKPSPKPKPASIPEKPDYMVIEEYETIKVEAGAPVVYKSKPVLKKPAPAVESNWKPKPITSKPIYKEIKILRKIHVVGEGETFYSIAKHHGISVQQLLFLNKMKEGERIKIGQELFLDCYCN